MSGVDRNDQLREYYNLSLKSCETLSLSLYLILSLQTYSSCTLTSHTSIHNCERCNNKSCDFNYNDTYNCPALNASLSRQDVNALQ